MCPLTSFTGELGVSFEHTLEAPHVIDKDQIWVACVPNGPNGMPLLGTYKNAEKLEYQDQLGLSILHFANIVPGGILVFLTSYLSLERLVSRWKATTMYSKLAQVKDIFMEPKKNENGNFDQLLQDYSESASGKGGIIFCIYRGKMSEGIDFADEKARAVILIGIPFPNTMDPKVAAKRKYNNQFCNSNHLLSGDEWFEIQAFRALNQALGRCIRHRNDWGAVILLDVRQMSSKNNARLPKWVRPLQHNYQAFTDAEKSLGLFVSSAIEKQGMTRGKLEEIPASREIEKCQKNTNSDVEMIVVDLVVKDRKQAGSGIHEALLEVQSGGITPIILNLSEVYYYV